MKLILIQELVCLLKNHGVVLLYPKAYAVSFTHYALVLFEKANDAGVRNFIHLRMHRHHLAIESFKYHGFQ